MKKILFLILFISSIFVPLFVKSVYGDELDDINKQLNDLKTAYNQSKAATAPLESQLSNIKNRVAFIETDLIRKKKEIDNGYVNLGKRKNKFLPIEVDGGITDKTLPMALEAGANRFVTTTFIYNAPTDSGPQEQFNLLKKCLE